MMEKQQYAVGDIVRMKKAHPCGSSEWEILRTGMDFRLKCLGCGHLVMSRARNSRRWSAPSGTKRGDTAFILPHQQPSCSHMWQSMG